MILKRNSIYTVSRNMSQVWLAITLIHVTNFFYNFWHVSTEDIQTSATCITFSITSYLLNLCCSEAAVTEMTRIVTIF